MSYKIKTLTLSLLGIIFSTSLLVNPGFAKQDKEKGLPPGLQKKVAKGKALPPGWQKKLVKGEKLDTRVYEQSKVVVPVDKSGMIVIEVDGKLIRLLKATHEIIDILK